MAISQTPQNSRRRSSRKRWLKQYILLLEVLISFTLATLCALPILHSQLALVRRELTTLRTLQLEIAARDGYMDLVERFLKQETAWGKLRRSNTLTISLEPVSIDLGDGRRQLYHRVAQVRIQEQKDKNQRANYRLLDLDIEVSPETDPNRKTTYAYHLFTRRRYVGKDEPAPIF